MYAQKAIKPNTLLRNGAYGIVMRGVQKCTCAGASLRGRNRLPLCCIKLDTATDPCMGSGHILVYAFDVLMQIYEASGYSQRDAAQSILENNLYGLDIDDRAAQLAYFAVMMKARQYDRRIFSRGIQPHVYAIVESNGLDSNSVEYFTNNDPKLQKDFGTLMDELRDAKEYGSILNISQVDFATLYARIDEVRDDISIFREVVLSSYLPLIQVAEVIARKYDVVVTNPPYMAVSNATNKVQEYIKKHFPDNKTDFFAVFVERCGQMLDKFRYQAMITQHGWMFLTSFEKMRVQTLQKDIVNMAHLGPRAFDEIAGEVVQTASFVIRKTNIPEYKANYHRLIEGDSESSKESMFLDGNFSFTAEKSNFGKIEGSPIAYWISDSLLDVFSEGTKLGELAFPCQGMATTNNDKFLKMWFEVVYSDIKFDAKSEEDTIENKFFPYNKGGEYRKWYGNNIYVVFFKNRGKAICDYIDSHSAVNHKGRVINRDKYFKENFTWGALAATLSCRYSPEGFIFDTKGSSCFSYDKEKLFYYLGFMNTKVSAAILELLAPTLDFNCGTLAKTPILQSSEMQDSVSNLVRETVSISRNEWDSFETSWDFVRHPIVPLTRERKEQETSQFSSSRMEKFRRISWHFEKWAQECEARFSQLKANEEELNRIFIDIYGLQDELTSEVEDKDVTVRKADLERDIRSLISYAVGCMFGRYSLDEPGLAYAGGEWDASKYSTIIPDKDNIIPICDDDYFDDDITGRFVKWVETVYGSDTLEENLKFIADALGGKGTAREVIRNYFINDFYADHLKIYQKRPIYWLFDSGKKNGFKALCYMHRYQRDLLARLRTDYVHEQQERYRTQLAQLGDAIDHASASERVKLTKQQKKIQEQALEIQKYEEKVHHLADQNISIDLDDGVKHNYELFADVLAKIK